MTSPTTLRPLASLIREQKPLSLLLFFLEAITTSLLQGISLLLIVPLLYVAGLITTDSVATSHNTLPEWARPWLAHASVEAVMLVYLAIVGGYALLRLVQQRNAFSMEQRFARQLRARAIGLLCGARWQAFNSRPHADMLQFINEETEKAGVLANQFLSCITQAVTTAILLALSIWVSPALTLSLLGWGGAAFLLLRPVNLAGQRAALDLQQARRHILRDIGHLLLGFKSFKVNRQEARLAQRLLATSAEIAAAKQRFFTLNSATTTGLELAGAIMIVLVVYSSFRLGKVQIDQLLTFVLLLSRLMPKANGLTNTWQRIVNMLPTYQNLREFMQQLETEQEVIGPHDTDTASFQCIELRGVSAAYAAREKPALRNIDLQINANTTTLITGASGGGKTTLLDVISGLLQPTAGQLLIDGVEPNALAWRDNISYMTQQPFIQTASIRDNLLWMQPNACEQQLWDALQQARLSETVRNLPQGLDTTIGENAGKLSGGERQRLALAMHLLKSAHVLIFDEVTSSLDGDNRTAIVESINDLHSHYTILIVAHDARGIAPVDTHIYMDNGRMDNGMDNSTASAINIDADHTESIRQRR
jgi:ABC-type bacteriocin/lantibiotic exporter with double-glycine peptidase domain